MSAAGMDAQRFQHIERELAAMNERLDDVVSVSTKTCEYLGDMLNIALKAAEAEDERRGKAVVEAMELGYRQGYEAAAGVALVEAKTFTGLYLVDGTGAGQ